MKLGFDFLEAIHMNRDVIKKIIIVMCTLAVTNAYATSDEWSKRWSASESRVNSNLTQANLIKLAESDYYDNLGKTTINNTTQIGEQNNISNIGQNTNSIGSMNSSTNNISVSGSGITTTVTNSSSNTGTIDSSIDTSTQTGNISQCLNLSVQAEAGSSCY
jgi:hypothetical protein